MILRASSTQIKCARVTGQKDPTNVITATLLEGSRALMSEQMFFIYSSAGSSWASVPVCPEQERRMWLWTLRVCVIHVNVEDQMNPIFTLNIGWTGI